MSSGGKGEPWHNDNNDEDDDDDDDDVRDGDGVSDGDDDDDDDDYDELWRVTLREREGEKEEGVLVAPRAEAARHCAKGRE